MWTQAAPSRLVVQVQGGRQCWPGQTEPESWSSQPGPGSVLPASRGLQEPSRPDPLLVHLMPFLCSPTSREQEGTESTSEEGQLPQVVEEMKDLQVAPGTRLAKFQLKVKGEEERQMARSAIWTVEAGWAWGPGGSEGRACWPGAVC